MHVGFRREISKACHGDESLKLALRLSFCLLCVVCKQKWSGFAFLRKFFHYNFGLGFRFLIFNNFEVKKVHFFINSKILIQIASRVTGSFSGEAGQDQAIEIRISWWS